ncbi:hypothetical protein [Veillonella sp. T34266-5]|uniref:hypothetical protein n=1 Tax=Veillonella sp. T34266-5 TaxID=2027457 RepID=UPI000CF4F61C|nr:hypothetical protein [Veillonella sp. T34266-5]PQL23369.1 hypothetical protein VIHSUH07_03050 [Veillonella sp. T34266-5]
MNTILDICKRSLYMNIFIVAIPVISYMIHNGSSATVALVWYLLLSLCIPWAYLSFKASTFGAENKRINRIIYVLGWAVIQFATYKLMFLGLDLNWLWGLPSVGRDIIFLVGMYGQVTIVLIIAYLISHLLGGSHE